MKNINIDGFGANEVAQITPIMSDLFKSYVQKPKEMSLTDWLSGQLGTHLTDKTAEMTGMMSSDILSKIDAFNNNMINMQEYCAQGKTRQQWLCEQLKEVPPGMNTNTYANYVSQAESALAMGNQVIIDAMQSPVGGTISLNDLNNQMIDVTPPGNMNWNNYTAAAMAWVQATPELSAAVRAVERRPTSTALCLSAEAATAGIIPPATNPDISTTYMTRRRLGRKLHSRARMTRLF